MKINVVAFSLLVASLTIIVFPSLTAEAAQGLQRLGDLAQTQPRSFLQRERDKLTYSPGSGFGWPEAAGSNGFLKRLGGEKGQQGVITPVAPAVEPIETSRDRTPPIPAPRQAQQRLNQLKKTVISKFQPKNESKQQPKQQTIALTPQQKREIRRRNRPDFLKSKVDPYDLVRAAREKHSPLQGHHLSLDGPNFTKLPNFTRPSIPAVVQQVPEQINQLKNTVNTKVSETIEQQSQPIKVVLTQPISQTLSETTKQLKSKAATQLIEPTNKVHNGFETIVETIVETKVKAPLRRLLHALGELAHQTAQQLD
ncbi:MAG: hypothetical protein AAFS04_07845 [Cyanobacteria bacterium J06631_9]